MLTAQVHVQVNACKMLNNGSSYRNTNPGAFFFLIRYPHPFTFKIGHKQRKIQQLHLKTGDFLYHRGRNHEVMFPTDTLPQLYHEDRGNNSGNVTTAAEASPTFNPWNSSEIFESKDGILRAEHFKLYLPYQNIK